MNKRKNMRGEKKKSFHDKSAEFEQVLTHDCCAIIGGFDISYVTVASLPLLAHMQSRLPKRGSLWLAHTVEACLYKACAHTHTHTNL